MWEGECSLVIPVLFAVAGVARFLYSEPGSCSLILLCLLVYLHCWWTERNRALGEFNRVSAFLLSSIVTPGGENAAQGSRRWCSESEFKWIPSWLIGVWISSLRGIPVTTNSGSLSRACSQCVCFIWRSTFNLKSHVTFSKSKIMSIDSYNSFKISP